MFLCLMFLASTTSDVRSTYVKDINDGLFQIYVGLLRLLVALHKIQSRRAEYEFYHAALVTKLVLRVL